MRKNYSTPEGRLEFNDMMLRMAQKSLVEIRDKADNELLTEFAEGVVVDMQKTMDGIDRSNDLEVRMIDLVGPKERLECFSKDSFSSVDVRMHNTGILTLERINSAQRAGKFREDSEDWANEVITDTKLYQKFGMHIGSRMEQRLYECESSIYETSAPFIFSDTEKDRKGDLIKVYLNELDQLSIKVGRTALPTVIKNKFYELWVLAKEKTKNITPSEAETVNKIHDEVLKSRNRCFSLALKKDGDIDYSVEEGNEYSYSHRLRVWLSEQGNNKV